MKIGAPTILGSSEVFEVRDEVVMLKKCQVEIVRIKKTPEHIEPCRRPILVCSQQSGLAVTVVQENPKR